MIPGRGLEEVRLRIDRGSVEVQERFGGFISEQKGKKGQIGKMEKKEEEEKWFLEVAKALAT